MKNLFALIACFGLLCEIGAQGNLIPAAASSFNNGCTGFQTDYDNCYTNENPSTSDYVSTFPYVLDKGIKGCYANDKYLYINGAQAQAQADSDFWKVTVSNLTAGRCYRFGVWVQMNAYQTLQLAIKKVGGNYQGRYKNFTGATAGEWKFVSGTFNTDVNQTSVILALRNTYAEYTGNGMYVDEVSLTQVNTYNTYSTCACPNSFDSGSWLDDDAIEDRDADLEDAPDKVDEWSVHVYPNPANDVINFALSSGKAGAYTFALYDAVGRSIYQSTEAFQLGTETGMITRDKSWSAGLYFATFTSIKTGKTIRKAVVFD